MCERWRSSFLLFLRDVGPRPSVDHSIDRIDVNGGYEPQNVGWATVEQQSNNMRTNVFLEYDDRRMTIAQWARAQSIDYETLRWRLGAGWPLARALTTPSSRRRPAA